MHSLTTRRVIPLTIAALSLLVLVVLLLVPPEQRLGGIIRSVFLHGALVQVALFTFAAAGLTGLAYLVRPGERLFQWCLALQKSAAVLWFVNAVASTIPTYQAWGVLIAWDEPRTRATAAVVGASLLVYLAARWVNDRTFTAIFNVILAVATWLLIKGATLVVHPFDPIGASSSATYKGFFVALLVLVTLLTVQLTRWFHRPLPDRQPSLHRAPEH